MCVCVEKTENFFDMLSLGLSFVNEMNFFVEFYGIGELFVWDLYEVLGFGFLFFI